MTHAMRTNLLLRQLPTLNTSSTKSHVQAALYLRLDVSVNHLLAVDVPNLSDHRQELS